MFMARRRLCKQAEELTRKVMETIVKKVHMTNPEFKEANVITLDADGGTDDLISISEGSRVTLKIRARTSPNDYAASVSYPKTITLQGYYKESSSDTEKVDSSWSTPKTTHFLYFKNWHSAHIEVKCLNNVVGTFEYIKKN